MLQNNAYDLFLDILLKRFTDKKVLAKRLSELLHIEKEAVYRRLRGTVPFSFTEITAIALHFDISLDNILALGGNDAKALPLRLTMANQWAPTDLDYFMLQGFIEDLKGLSNYSKSEFISITNTIPQIFYTYYEHLYRFYLFKWQYEQDNNYTKIPYKEIYPTERLKEINKEYQKYSKTAHNNIIIWDKNTLRILVSDIRYFYDIHLITFEEMKEIGEDLRIFMDDLQKIAVNGHFENGKKINFYVSHISIKGSYNIITINPNYKLSMMKWFTINDTIATDSFTYDKMIKSMLSLQRSSILISESGEIQRIRFFEEQQEIISALTKL